MASSSAASLSKTQQYSQRKFAETNPKTLVGLHKTDSQLKKMMDTLEQQQKTAVNNIANHQQAMKMSWRRLEERRTTSPLMTRKEKEEVQAKKTKKSMMLQSNTRLFNDKTPQIYGGSVGETARPSTVDDSMIGRSRARSLIQNTKPGAGPSPTQLTRAQTSPYISTPLNFRKPIREMETHKEGSDTSLDSQDLSSSSSSQPMLIKSSSINSKEKLLKASELMDIKSSGSATFKGFYSGKPRNQSQRPSGPSSGSPLVMSQKFEEALNVSQEDDKEDAGKDEVTASSSMPSLEEQFEQIKNCKYIRHSRHYHPERATEDY